MVQNPSGAAGSTIVAIRRLGGVLAAWGVVLIPAVGGVLVSFSTIIVAINAPVVRRARL